MFGDIRRIVLNDYFRDFETMNDIAIHHRNIQTLMTELTKIKYDLAPPIIDSLLNRITICYNCRNLQEFLSERNRTMFYGLETISYAHPNYVQFCRKSLNKGTQQVFLKVMSDNGYVMSVRADCAKYLYQTCGLFEVQLLTWYFIFIIDFLTRALKCFHLPHLFPSEVQET